MASEHINIILEAESRAQGIDLKAKQEADRIIAAAEEAATSDYANRISEMHDCIRDDLSAFEEQNQAYMSEARQSAEDEAAALRNLVEPKIAEAAMLAADILSGKG